MTPRKLTEAYRLAGYTAVAWQVWLLPWHRCGCGRWVGLRWRSANHLFVWYHSGGRTDTRARGPWRTKYVCEQCWRVVELTDD